MKARRSIPFYVCFLVTLISIICACAGGGTSGTDGGIQVRFLGTIQDPNGAPLPGVQITPIDGSSSGTSDAAGRFDFTDTVPTGPVELAVARSDFEPKTVEVTPQPTAEGGLNAEVRLEVDVLEGSVTVLSVDATAPTEDPASSDESEEAEQEDQRNSQVKGSLEDERGQPISGASVTAEGISGRATTDGSGSFSFRVRSGLESIVLRVRFQARNSTVRVRNIPNRPVVITVRLQLNLGDIGSASGDSSLELESVSFRDR